MHIPPDQAGPQGKEADGLNGDPKVTGLRPQQIQRQHQSCRSRRRLFCHPANGRGNEIHKEQIPQKPQVVHHRPACAKAGISIQPVQPSPGHNGVLGEEAGDHRQGLADQIEKNPQCVQQQIGHRQGPALLAHIFLPGKRLPEQQHSGDQEEAGHGAPGNDIRAQTFDQRQPGRGLEHNIPPNQVDPLLIGVNKHHHEGKPQLRKIQPLRGPGGNGVCTGLCHGHSPFRFMYFLISPAAAVVAAQTKTPSRLAGRFIGEAPQI